MDGSNILAWPDVDTWLLIDHEGYVGDSTPKPYQWAVLSIGLAAVKLGQLPRHDKGLLQESPQW